MYEYFFCYILIYSQKKPVIFSAKIGKQQMQKSIKSQKFPKPESSFLSPQYKPRKDALTRDRTSIGFQNKLISLQFGNRVVINHLKCKQPKTQLQKINFLKYRHQSNLKHKQLCYSSNAHLMTGYFILTELHFAVPKMFFLIHKFKVEKCAITI